MKISLGICILPPVVYEDGIMRKTLFTPGCTELAGNHTDHQHGRILASGVDLGLHASMRRTTAGFSVSALRASSPCGTGDGSLSRSVTYFEHLVTADFETPVKREICLTDRPASSKRDMISFRCNASCWNDETLRQPERRQMGQRTVRNH